MPDTRDIAEKALKGAKWVLLASFAVNLLQPLFTVLLARILTPNDYGLIAYVMIYVSAMSLIQDLGIRYALIQRQDKTDDVYYTAFIIHTLLGAAWYVATFLVAPYFAAYFHNPEITLILRITALSFVITPFDVVQNTLLVQDLRFKKQFHITVIPVVLSGALSLVLASLKCGVWSLVAGFLMSSFLNVLIAWILVPWRPRGAFDRHCAMQMLGFGGTVSLELVLYWALNTVDNILVGQWLGNTALGLYSMAFTIGLLPAKNIVRPIYVVIFPVFSKLQGNREELRTAFLKVFKHASLVTFPMGTGMAVTASLFIPVLLGNKWLPIVPLVQLLPFYGISMSIDYLISPVYKALGRPDIYLKFVFIKCLVALPVYYLVIPYGLVHLATAHVVLTVVFAPINVYLALRFLALEVRHLVLDLKSSVIGSLSIATLAITLQYALLHGIHMRPGGALIVTIVAAIPAYILTVFLVSRATYEEAITLARKAVIGNNAGVD